MAILTLIPLIGIIPFASGQQLETYREDELYREVLLTYTEKANHAFSTKEYQTALENYQRVASFLQSHQLSDPSRFLQAICGSMFCYEMLNQEPFAKAAFDELMYAVSMLYEKILEIDWIVESYTYPFLNKIHLAGLPESTPEENCQLQCRGKDLS